ncbi:hypothetical protein PABG_04103 [Paracoccidioides brasiliensis Pb03]|uniref:DJ-1/PfpI domain-containing protein n=1 Tax=Paracoccidioides brasiliensis (strain Pb18) TaxID=502780 RepID=C1GJX6_PARBD|nr:uncharacterized protein PADG_07562 [Paracoccidioides brasiliensis Pb18]EEH21887.1 hypothetical protein PABG_04103 [Paracoccidioides brasiliensis Pb03]EEH42742.1 hypothetical protein PADG_07562 [Paracoccidioides brasiliensis Pb18]
MSGSNSFKVLILPFPEFDTLDVYAPIEVLGKGAAIGGVTITFDIATASKKTLSAEKIPVVQDLSICEALQQLEQYEIVIQPGGAVSAIQKYLENPAQVGLDQESVDEHLQLLLRFSQLETLSPRGCRRVLMSICTGALIAGLSGAFSNLTVTTHYSGLQQLKEYCQRGGQGTIVDPDIGEGGYVGYAAGQLNSKRWVLSDRSGCAVRVISSGGISCGLDASLFLVSELEVWKDGHLENIGLEKAHQCARIMDYAWRWA